METIKEWDESSTSTDAQVMKANLPLVLGKRKESGEYAVLDLCSACGILMAGMDDFFISALYESILASLLYYHSRKELSFLFIDTNDMFFEYSERLNCLETVAGLEQSKKTMQWLWNEMERRYAVLTKAKCRTIQDFNSDNADKMPFIVVCISDLEDWADIREKDKDFTRMWMEVSQKGRAVGIHFIAATGYPTAKVLPSSVTANFPVRIALKLPNANQSKIVINMEDAEKLESDYEMYLYDITSGKAEIVEWQGTRYEDFKELINKYIKE